MARLTRPRSAASLQAAFKVMENEATMDGKIVAWPGTSALIP
jgi:hypothetical protein